MFNERTNRHQKSLKKKKQKKSTPNIETIFTKDTASLLSDYLKIIERISDINSDSISDLISNAETKYFLIQNDLYYNIFRECIKLRRLNFIE